MPCVSRIAALVGVALLGADARTDADTAEQAAPPDDLFAQLREGGLTVVIRHAATDRSEPDDAEVDLDDCSTQRNLSEKGREDAEAIGEAVDSLGIPAGVAEWRLHTFALGARSTP